MLPPMKRALTGLALLGCALALGAGCDHEEKELEVIEGEPVHLGEVAYTVQLTRTLNPGDVEDAEYLVGQPTLEPGKEYLGVFMLVENEGDEPEPLAEPMEVIDTRGNAYHPIESESPFALPLDAEVPADGQLPVLDTAAAAGPVKGGLVLFEVDSEVTENRPIELELPGPDGETGLIELDI
jgi:hypothetical protein